MLILKAEEAEVIEVMEKYLEFVEQEKLKVQIPEFQHKGHFTKLGRAFDNYYTLFERAKFYEEGQGKWSIKFIENVRKAADRLEGALNISKIQANKDEVSFRGQIQELCDKWHDLDTALHDKKVKKTPLSQLNKQFFKKLKSTEKAVRKAQEKSGKKSINFESKLRVYDTVNDNLNKKFASKSKTKKHYKKYSEIIDHFISLNSNIDNYQHDDLITSTFDYPVKILGQSQ